MTDIVVEIEDLIHAIKGMEISVNNDRKDTVRVLSNGDEQEVWQNTAKTYENGLIDAQDALQRAEESLSLIRHWLGNMVEDVEYARLSNAAQGK